MQEIGKEEKEMEMDCIIGKLEKNIEEIGKMIK